MRNNAHQSHQSDAEELSAHTPRKDIQALRALAVFIVVAFHAGLPFHGGYIGVDVFFVISGFVITGMLLRERTTTGRNSLRRFFSRRLKRLFPALLLVVLVTLALSFALGSPFDSQQQMTAMTASGTIVGLANVVLIFRSGGYFATPPESNPLLNMWSLSVEEQFYLFFPAAIIVTLWLGNRYLRGRSRFLLLSLLIATFTIVSFVLSVLMSYGVIGRRFSNPLDVAFYASPTRAWEFGVGALLVLLLSKFRMRESTSLIIYACGVSSIIGCALFLSPGVVFPGWIVVVPVVGAALAIMGGGSLAPSLTRRVASRPIVAMGDLSYSWYLWHWPLIAFALMLWPTVDHVALIAAVVSIPVAVAAFRYVESPLRFSSTLVRGRLNAFVLGGVGAVLAVSALMYVGSQHLWWNAGVTSMAAQVGSKHVWETQPCNSSTPLGSRPDACTFNATGERGTTYLVGDSQAGMLSEAVIDAGVSDGRAVQLGTMGACPFADLYVTVDGRPADECRSFVADSTHWLERQQPGTVVISNWAAYTWLDNVNIATSPDSPRLTPAARLTAYLEGLGSTVQRLRAAGHSVVLVDPIPGFPAANPQGHFWYPYQCSTVTAMRSAANCGQTRSRTSIDAELAPIREGIQQIAAKTGSSVIDLEQELCADGVCVTNRADDWLYLDGQHISVNESKALSARFRTVG